MEIIMKMYEFGKENEKTILLLHGAGCTYKMWTPQIQELEKTYHIFAPTLSGHEEGDVDFISSADEAEKLLYWFQEHQYSNVFLICGASLGAHVAAELLQQSPAFAEYAMIESLKANQYKGTLLKLFSRFGKWLLKRCAAKEGYMAGTYQQKHASDDTKDTLRHMTETSLDNIMLESGHYRIKEQTQRIQAKTLILYGSKEKKVCELNTNILKAQIDFCKVEVIPGFSHGELSIGNPKKHLEYLQGFVKESE